MVLSLRARTVVPIDRPAIDDGIVTIDGQRIVAVEPAMHWQGPVRDLGDVVLLPGPVNAHTHLEFSHLRAPLGRPGMPLVEWLPLAIAERQRSETQIVQSIAAGIQESIRRRHERARRRHDRRTGGVRSRARDCRSSRFSRRSVSPAHARLRLLPRSNRESSRRKLETGSERRDIALFSDSRRTTIALWSWWRASVRTRRIPCRRNCSPSWCRSPATTTCRWRCTWPRAPTSSTCCRTAAVRSATCSKRGACGTRRP